MIINLKDLLMILSMQIFQRILFLIVLFPMIIKYWLKQSMVNMKLRKLSMEFF